MPCFPATVQAPIKEYCRPAVWMPGAKTYHSHSECWKIDADLSRCIEETLIAVENLNEVEHPDEYLVNKVNHSKHWVQLYCYSATGWLDVLEITFIPVEENSSYAKVQSFSTGALPAWLPLGFICDMILCWLPFSDSGSNSYRCQILRQALPFHIDILDEKETDRLLFNQRQSNRALKYKSDNLKSD